MGCSSATFDPDEGGYQCAVSGNDCMYFMPDSRDVQNNMGKDQMPIMKNQK